jgi:hypothetical protein
VRLRRVVPASQLCLEEAVANIIMHGGAKDEGLQIAVELERNGGTLVARIEDNGRPFDPTRAPSPALANSLEEASSLRDFRILDPSGTWAVQDFRTAN